MIPKTIHQIWIGSELPDAFKRSADQIIKLHPDFEYKLWTEDDIPSDLINQDIIQDCLDRKELLSVVSDCIRYEILARHGGVYIDCDILLFKSISKLIENKTEVLTGENSSTVTNCFIAAEQNHPLFHHLINGLRKQYYGLRDTDSILLSAGIFYYSNTVREWPDDLFILPREYFIPFCQYHKWDQYWENIKPEYPRDHWYGFHYWGHLGTTGIGHRLNEAFDLMEGKDQ